MMKTRAVGVLFSLLLILVCAIVTTIATTTETTTSLPELANLHDLIVELNVIPFATYPSREADTLEAKIRGEVEPLLSKAGFAVLRPSADHGDTPTLTFEITSARDEKCPNMFALHARVKLLDRVLIHRRGVGRIRTRATIWEWWDGGDLSLAEREEVQSTIEDWAHDATTAFVKAVRNATKLEKN